MISAQAQPCKKKYKEKLESSSKLINCGENFTIEKLNSGSTVIKIYYPENKQITRLATYKSDKLKELHGLYKENWDDGTLVVSGKYENNKKVGEWRENVNDIGNYDEGHRYGEWKTLNQDSLVIEIKNYVSGELNGERIIFDSLGNIKLREVYDKGDLLSRTADTSKIYKEELPRFPGCEEKGLIDEELQNCSNRMLLEYIYQNIKYPREAREKNIEGEALVRFTIDKDGSVNDIRVLNGVSKDIKDEVVSLINKMPKWEPGKQDGQPVNVLFTLPVNFKLE